MSKLKFRGYNMENNKLMLTHNINSTTGFVSELTANAHFQKELLWEMKINGLSLYTLKLCTWEVACGQHRPLCHILAVRWRRGLRREQAEIRTFRAIHTLQQRKQHLYTSNTVDDILITNQNCCLINQTSNKKLMRIKLMFLFKDKTIYALLFV